ncbi:phosphatase PAP2 family protein [Mesorhizobium sp. LNJC403B00]|uniref:phosphatase PAP2 family protein n=1 Tax=Mesorhizobium sp. LNJC403B00 TaxID=1287280 RepID=UPI0032B020C5
MPGGPFCAPWPTRTGDTACCKRWPSLPCFWQPRSACAPETCRISACWKTMPNTFFSLSGSMAALGSFFHLAQDIVWSGYIGATPGSLGISAFPSMHVAMAVLFALYATRRSRLAGLLMWAFAAIIMVGSVVLGWHYAVDGYASVLISIAIWKACGYFLGKFAPEGGAA